MPHLPDALDCEVTEAKELFLEIDEGPLVDVVELFLETGCKHRIMSTVCTCSYMYRLVRWGH